LVVIGGVAGGHGTRLPASLGGEALSVGHWPLMIHCRRGGADG